MKTMYRIVVLFFFSITTGHYVKAQSIYDSIVIEYLKTNGGAFCHYTIFPKGLPEYELDKGPAISVERSEYRTCAIRKNPGTGFAYTEMCQSNYSIENEFLKNDSTGISYYDRLLSLCQFIISAKGNVWIRKSSLRDSTVEGYAVCRIYFYNSIIGNQQNTTMYQFEHYRQDVFCEEYLQFLSTLNDLNNIPKQYMTKEIGNDYSQNIVY